MKPAAGESRDSLRPDHAGAWLLDPEIDYLNHGSFGACPRVILDRQQALRDEMEAEPVQFMSRRMQPLVDASRGKIAALVGAEPDDIVFVANATAAVNAVLRSKRFSPGDEILVTDHGYNACNNVAHAVAERDRATVVAARIPFPLATADEVVDAMTRVVTERTRFAVIDHVTSATGLVLPIERLVALLEERGVEVLVDGAHAPGMVPIDVAALGTSYYTGNCHKWLCAPKGAGFLYASRERQGDVQPPVVSHGWNMPRPERSRFSDLFDWPGTLDPTPWCCVAGAIDFVSSLLPGGLGALMESNRRLVLEGRRVLCEALAIESPAPDDMIGSLATVPLPDDPSPVPRLDARTMPTPTHSLQVDLFERHGIEVPVSYFPRHPRRIVRISAQVYNTAGQYERLAEVLKKCLAEEGI